MENNIINSIFYEKTNHSSIEISNSNESAIKSGKWSNPGASLYDRILKASNWEALLNETYLTVGDIKNTPHGVTPYSRSDCKYPHHVVKGDKLVLHEAGVKAAYSRARQQGVFRGDIKTHLINHYKELGIYDESAMNMDEKMDQNFYDIEEYIREGSCVQLKVTDLPDDIHKIVEDLNNDIVNKIKPVINKNYKNKYDIFQDKKIIDEIINNTKKIGIVNIDAKPRKPEGSIFITTCPQDFSFYDKTWKSQNILYDLLTEVKNEVDEFNENPKDRPGMKLILGGDPVDNIHEFELVLDTNVCKRILDHNGNTIISESTEDIEEKDELVPIFGIVKSYDLSLTYSDGTPKDPVDISSIKYAKIIGKLTGGDKYSHAIVSLDNSFEKMYSYEIDGFVIDNIMTEQSWLRTKSIYITVMFVTEEERSSMQTFIDYLIEHQNETKYAYVNLLKAFFGKPVKMDKRFICSSFVGYIIAMGNPKNLHRDYSRLRPEDVTILPRAFYVMNIKDRNDFIKNHKELQNRVKNIYQEYRDEIMDYNNHLPKILLKEKMGELKFFDKIFNWIADHLH